MKALRPILSKIIIFVLTVVIISTQASDLAYAAKKKKAVIVLDPGHGTDYEYTIFDLDGVIYTEYQLNWDIAMHLKKILEQYPELDVRLSKKNATIHPSLKDRVVKAKKIKKKTKLPTYLISLHNNARNDGFKGVESGNRNGCFVISSNKNYKPWVAKKIDPLAEKIVDELSDLGLKVNYEDKKGIYRRDSKTYKYPNGKKCDYYGLIKHGVLMSVPTIIVEHAYMTNEEDAMEFLISDAGLYRLAVADAKAIVDFFDLDWKKLKDGVDDEDNVDYDDTDDFYDYVD